jgi:hypothetical protein
MHGSGCPAVYAPIGTAGDRLDVTADTQATLSPPPSGGAQ